jgi:hypothetical protein
VSSFGRLCLEVFLLAQSERCGLPDRHTGRYWELRLGELVAKHRIAIESVPGGCSVLGFCSQSGLAHQIDATLSCTDALVLAEWKAYRDDLPKNELLRFKAATDDYYMSFREFASSRRTMRIFGGIGRASNELRAYAALHGIAVIEDHRWPIPVLCDVVWPFDPANGPSLTEREALAWGVRSLQQVLGACRLPRSAVAARVEAVLALQDFWSERLWESIDLRLETPQVMLTRLERPRRDLGHAPLR